MTSLRAAIANATYDATGYAEIPFDWRTLSSADNPQLTIAKRVADAGAELCLFGNEGRRYFIIVRKAQVRA